jgi:type II secretory pathway component PulK
VEELLLIKGFDPEILYGDEEHPGLAKYVTVFGDPKGTVNINTADEKVLTAVLKSESEASMIVDMREDRPFETAADIAGRLPGINLKKKMTTASSYFLVSATGRAPAEGDPAREVQIKAFLKREIPEGLESEDQYLRVNTAFWKMGR